MWYAINGIPYIIICFFDIEISMMNYNDKQQNKLSISLCQQCNINSALFVNTNNFWIQVIFKKTSTNSILVTLSNSNDGAIDAKTQKFHNDDTYE